MKTIFDDRAMVRALAGIVGLWFLAAIVSSSRGMFLQPEVPRAAPGLLLGAFVALPVLGFVLAYALSARVRHTLNQVPLRWITAAHIVRFVGVYFVLGVPFHYLPPQFGLPAGFGDIISAVGATALVIVMRRGPRSEGLRRKYVAWGLFGMADFIAAITLGVLYSDGPLGVLTTEITTAPLERFPVSLILTFLVPLLICLQLLGLRRNLELLPAGRNHEGFPLRIESPTG